MNDISVGAAVQHLRRERGSAGPAQAAPPVDPGSVLASLGFLAYGWNVGSGALSFAGDVGKVLPGDWGHGFESVARLEESQVPPSPGLRQAALFGEERLDDGSGIPYGLSYRLRSKDGRLFLVEESGRWFAGLPGHPMSARGLMRVRPLLQEPREEEAGAGEPPARSPRPGGLLEALERATQQAQRTRRGFAVLAVAAARGPAPALGEFGEAYDASEAFASRLRRVMRRGDTLLRIDAETSLCVLNACDETQLATAIRRLEAAFALPEAGEGGEGIKSSIVGATWKGSHANAHMLAGSVIERARAQLGGGDEAPLSLPAGAGMPSGRQPVDWHKEILRALNERRLALAYQPVVNAGSRSIAFHEGLLRLRNRAGRLLPAAVFIPASEENGLVSLLDLRVIELAAEALAQRPDLKLSINASAPSLCNPEWLAALRSYALSSKAFAGRLILEITESMALVDIKRTIEVLGAVKALGVGVAIDDFGAGHTSFRNLRDLPVDIVKIDGAFVQDVDRSSDGRFFIRTLVDLARHIGCKVVGEWVENEASARIIETIGVDYLQGRLFGAPKLLGQPKRVREEGPRRRSA
jgi:EAL domain-containing protein (putative c-di-GMP-specific phosphodiesterase class I)/GGDEF domain-containing protein